MINFERSPSLDKNKFLPDHAQLRTLVELLVNEVAEESKCIVTIFDTYYRRRVDPYQFTAKRDLPIFRVC